MAAVPTSTTPGAAPARPRGRAGALRRLTPARILFFLIFQKRIVGGLTGAVKG